MSAFIAAAGYLGVFIIYYTKYLQNDKLDKATSIAILAMVYYIFMSVNSQVQAGMVTL